MEFPLTTKTGKKYREGEYKGKAAWFYESGTILDAGDKTLLRGPLDARITTENNGEYQGMREEKRLQAVRDAIIRGTGVNGNEFDALGVMTEAQTRLSLQIDGKNPGASTKAFQLLIAQAGLGVSDGKVRVSDGERVLEATTIEDMRLLIAAVRGEKQVR